MSPLGTTSAMGRAKFLRCAATLALGAIAGAPATGWGMRLRKSLDHPEPRRGITAAHVLADAALPREPKVRAAYAAARANPGIFDGLYCACNCRDSLGHRSLLACYETQQPTGCEACQEEAALVGRLAARGKRLAEIRGAVDRANS